MNQAQQITLALGGDWCGGYGLAPTPGHSSRDRGLKIWDAPDLAGGVGFHAFNGASWQEVRDELRALGLLSDERTHDRADLEAIAARRREREAEQRRADARRTARALEIWRASGPVSGSLAETYLRQARSIRRVILPPTLRFHPCIPFKPLAPRNSGPILPAMVAAVAMPGERTPCAVHITFLSPDGLDKADVDPPRKIVGPYKGAAVRLDPAGERLAVGEGIESTLSYGDHSGAPVWACLTAGNLETVHFPAGLKRLEAAHDVDANGRGQKAADIVAARAFAAGVDAYLAPPPDGLNDWNAYAAREAA
ncbi:DUF7146 domain-containing protein [Marinicauda pacifica]|uniref:DUF7146 domain-containing protein n=1 Tax=Marinicauda pacifica TaxID=1133559 RepID=UPI0035C7CE96